MFVFSSSSFEDMSDQGTTTTTTNTEGKIFHRSIENHFCLVEQHVLPTTKEPQASAAASSQQINVVDDATLQAVLSSMSETEMNAFLEELNKTGKACKNIKRRVYLIAFAPFLFSFTRYRSND